MADVKTYQNGTLNWQVTSNIFDSRLLSANHYQIAMQFFKLRAISVDKLYHNPIKITTHNLPVLMPRFNCALILWLDHSLRTHTHP